TFSFPRLNKIVINCRCSASKDDSGELDNAKEEIMAITGQKPLLARAKKSVASFKLKMGEPLAYKVTLRGQRMYDFAEKLFNIVLPRLRDFQGFSDKAFDGQGNYNLVIKDQTYFPEINQDKVNKIRSVQATFVTSSSSKKEAKMLLSALGFPFAK
ncbi:50S ribosomal protein L5, partial [Patescibacteria group bacterium]|nr:50S ribosomal protein L5 [Patescibacteria group bacterium]